MPPLGSSRATRSRRFRQSSAPKTPEPTSAIGGETQPPSPPRLRFRLRRRTSSQLNAPTSQFLASVAAADVPITSIEEPKVYDDEDMLSIAYPAITQFDRFKHDLFTDQSSRGSGYSPPRTPAPCLEPSLSPRQFPDWSLDGTLSSFESSPEYESSRPSTARSTQTSSSLFSRHSLISDDLCHCAGPSDEHSKQLGRFLAPEDADKTIKPVPHHGRSIKSRRALWIRPMSQHLWSTYMTYLQDPKVTPFRVGKSGIPPTGVCMRVAREAKRSWKGSRPQLKPNNKSSSSTPTAKSSGPYIEWSHTCAATRGHLRELCKAHSAYSTRQIQYLSHNPTPVGKTVSRFWNRRSAPARSPSVFSSSDMAMSLTVCTSDSMQIQGPLAQLTGSQLELEAPSQPVSIEPSNLSCCGELVQSRPPLGSPFMARSYGPSSSGLAGGAEESSDIQRHSLTVGTSRGLRSPVRLDQNHHTNTQKRRSRQSVLEPRRTKRPSLGTDFWIDPSIHEDAETSPSPASSQLPEFSSTDSDQRDNLFVPRTNLQELFEASSNNNNNNNNNNNKNQAFNLGSSASFAVATGLTSSQTAPARLGSPFSAKTISHSFPNRHSRVSSLDVDAFFRPFATLQSARPDEISSSKTPLVNRLAYIDERLKDFRRCKTTGRRSQSPL